MIGAGTVINPIVKIVTTIAILAAVYFFIVKPTLDTTENITNSVTESVNDATDEAFDSIPETPSTKKIQRQVRKNIEAAQSGSGSAASTQVEKLGECMQDAVGDVAAVEACAKKYGP
jgi:phage-related protein